MDNGLPGHNYDDGGPRTGEPYGDAGDRIGRSIFDFLVDYPQLEQNIRRVLAGEEVISEVDFDGIFLDAHCSPFRDASGRIIGMIGVATDISAPGQGSRIELFVPMEEAPSSGEDVPKTRLKTSVSPGIAPPIAERKIRVLLADDHEVVRKGLNSLLSQEPDFEIIGEASDGYAAVSLAHQLLPDVVILDVNMPGCNGIEATRLICTALPRVRVIGLSMFEETEICSAMLQVGAVAYLSKNGATDNVIAAIRASCTRAVIRQT